MRENHTLLKTYRRLDESTIQRKVETNTQLGGVGKRGGVRKSFPEAVSQTPIFEFSYPKVQLKWSEFVEQQSSMYLPVLYLFQPPWNYLFLCICISKLSSFWKYQVHCHLPHEILLNWK